MCVSANTRILLFVIAMSKKKWLTCVIDENRVWNWTQMSILSLLLPSCRRAVPAVNGMDLLEKELMSVPSASLAWQPWLISIYPNEFWLCLAGSFSNLIWNANERMLNKANLLDRPISFQSNQGASVTGQPGERSTKQSAA